MKSYHRVLLCCFVAGFCSAVEEFHGDLLDDNGNALKEGNLTADDRPENGVIKPTNIREDLLVKSNPGVFLNDTGDENAFEIPDDMCKTDFPKCTSTGGNCNVKVEEESEKSAVQCECPDKSVYEASEGCTVPDEMCKTYFPKCMDTGGKCNVEVGNEKEQSTVHCECTNMKGYKEGVGCKDCNCGTGSRGCKFSKRGQKVCKCNENFSQNGDTCEECDCGVGSSSCAFEYGAKSCTCLFKFEQKGDKCEECDCGPSFECKFVNGEKKCECYSRYGQKDGVCTECGCGKKSYSCIFEKDEKICECFSGYGQKYGVCTKCDCGYNSRGCNFENGKKKCDCHIRYGQMGRKCIDCACGPSAWRCSFDGDTKACECFRNYAQKDGECVACDCGTHGTESCHFDNGKIKCVCEEGFTVVNGICKDLDVECKKICGYDKDVTCELKGKDILCLCDEGKQFDVAIKKCRIDNCYENCGVNSGEVHDEVQCRGNPFGEVDCICSDDHKKFDPDMRKCRDLSAECEDICGLDKDVTCEPNGKDILCLCDEGKQFDSEIKKCRRQNQTQSGLSASTIAGIVVGISVAIVLLSAAVHFYLKYSKKSQFQSDVNDYRISSENTFNMTKCTNREF